MSTKDSCLELAFRMGTILLENGAEITRVQETMERVAAAYKADEFNVYVLSNAIFANGMEAGVNRRTEIKFIKSSSIHFGRISAVNQISREIVKGNLTVNEAWERLEKINDIPFTKKALMVAACAVSAAGFCFIYGGSLWDSLAALICGFVLQLFLSGSEKHLHSKFMVNILASSLVALVALGLHGIGLGENSDKIIAGSIIRLVPGVALTTAIRDFLSSDYLSGTIHMIDAALIGGSIAVGVGVIVKLSSLIPGLML